MRNKTCCFTGHRTIPTAQYALLQEQLEQIIVSLIQSGYRYFGAGGALGFDTMAACTILKLRNVYPWIRLILILPCPKQSERWTPADQHLYERIKQQADKVVFTSDRYTSDCMFVRNRHLVDCSSVCVCYLTRSTGGTAYTVWYAQQKHLRILRLPFQTE